MGEEKRSHVILSSLKVGIMTQWENNNIYMCTKDTLHVSTCSGRHLLDNKVVASEDATAIINLPAPCAGCCNTTLTAQSAAKDDPLVQLLLQFSVRSLCKVTFIVGLSNTLDCEQQ